MARPHRVLLTSSLSLGDYGLLAATPARLLAGVQDVVIVTGAEALAERYAQERGFAVKQFLADWKLYGRGAKVIRAHQLIEAADRAVFFWDGKNKGIAELIEKAEDKGITVDVVRFT
jgi:hypothetical protein